LTAVLEVALSQSLLS